MWLDGEPPEPEPEPEPKPVRSSRPKADAGTGELRRVRSRGVGSRDRRRHDTVDAKRGLVPLPRPAGGDASAIVAKNGTSSMPAGELAQQLKELGIAEPARQQALPAVRSVPASVGRLTPIPGVEITVDGAVERRKQLFGGSSVASSGDSFNKPRDKVLDRVAVARGREIAAQIIELDKQIEGGATAKKTAAEASKHKLMGELKDNQEAEMVVLNLRLGLKEDKAWGDHAFSPVLSGPTASQRGSLSQFDAAVDEAAAVVIQQAFGAGGAGEVLSPDIPKVHSAGRQARAPVEVEDSDFTTAFHQMELALAAWPSLPADNHDPLKVDRRVSDRLIDAAAPNAAGCEAGDVDKRQRADGSNVSGCSFRVVWWRVVEALGYIPHSDEAHRIVPVTIFRQRCTVGRMGNTVPPFWQEVEPPDDNAPFDSSIEKLVLQCHVTMSVLEAHEKVLEADLGEGLAERRGFAYNETDALAVDLEFFSHRWIRPWWSGEGCELQPVRGTQAHVSYNAHPDCEHGSKARALALYGRAAANAGHDARDKFYWIDFVCIDQRSPSAGIGMLPLYLANCDKLVYHDHAEYGRRGWTMLERTVFAAFNKPVIAVLQPRLGTLESGRPILPQAGSAVPFSGKSLRTAASRTLHVLDNPSDGLLTDPETDRPLLARLLELTQKRWALCWRGATTQWSLQGMRGLERLEFGKTEVVVETAAMLDVVGGGSGKGLLRSAGGSNGSSANLHGVNGGGGGGGARQMDAMGSIREMEQRMKEKRRHNAPWEAGGGASGLSSSSSTTGRGRASSAAADGARVRAGAGAGAELSSDGGVRLARMVAGRERGSGGGGGGGDGGFVMPTLQ